MRVPGGKFLKRAMKVPRGAMKYASDITGFERELTKKALQLGVSGEVIGRAIRFRRIVSSPAGYLRRNGEAKRISATSEYAGFIDLEKGYRLFSEKDLPGVREAVAVAERFYEEKKNQPREGSKPFFANICDDENLRRHPDLLAFPKSRPVFEIAADYLRTAPKLSAFGVFYSPPNELLEKSQMWHIDDEDFCQLKCFINIHEVGPAYGPFTFIPAAKSDEIRRKLGHSWRGKRVEDAEILAHCSEEDIVAVTGAPGSGVFVDTSRCLHFGSRARGGHRLVTMFQYTRTPDLNFIPRDARKNRSILLTDH